MKRLFYSVLFFLVVSNLLLISQNSINQIGPNFFGEEELMNVSLKFDITDFKKVKSKEDYVDATLTVFDIAGDSVDYNIRLRSRGNFRHEMCALPPIRLNFKNCENKPEDLGEENNIKLVTHCISSSKFEENLLKEYLIYKLYNIVTDSSLKVRLLKVNYIDTGKNNRSDIRYGFIVEPIKILAARINATEKEDIVIREDYVDKDLYDKLCLFQFMIGNDDWFLPKLHNLKLLEPITGDKMILSAIPYDFDFAGLINAAYAVPNTYYGLSTIQERVYVGPCRSDESIRALVDEFLDYKEAFYSTINNFEHLDDKQKKRVLNYIDSFYNLYNRDNIIREIKSTCKKL